MTGKSKPPNGDRPKRTRTSSVSYPYHPLSLCIPLAKAVSEIGNGRSEVSRSLLASHLNVDEKSADFAQKLASTKCYGLIEGRTQFKLTDLAAQYFFPKNDPDRDRKLAIMQAAGSPGAFSALIEKYDGSKPQPELLGNVLNQDMGIPPTWKQRVTAFFLRSMETAGAMNSDGFLRYKAELEKWTKGVIHPPLGGNGGGSGSQTGREKTDTSDGNGGGNGGGDDTDDGVDVWLYRFRGKQHRFETPENLTLEVWEKLNRYLQAVKPEK